MDPQWELRFSALEERLSRSEEIIYQQRIEIQRLHLRLKAVEPLPCYLFHLPEQLVVHIMTYLSSTSLAQFGCVSTKSKYLSNCAAYSTYLDRYAKEVTNPEQSPIYGTNKYLRMLHDLELSTIMIFAGGPYEEPNKTDQFVFNTHTLEWKQLSDPTMDCFTRSAEFETVYFKGQILVFSDCDAMSHLKSGEQLQIYDCIEKKWFTCPTLGEIDKAFAMGLIPWNGRLLITGGHIHTDRNNTILNTMYVIDRRYREGEPYNLRLLPSRMGSLRSHHGAVIYNGELWVAGGQLSTYEPTSTTDIFKSLDGERGEWVRGPSMRKIRDGCPKMAVIQGHLYAIGGDFDVHDDLRSTIEVLDPDTNTWSLVGQFKEPRAFSSAAVVGHHVYIFGGCVPEISDDVTYLNTWDCFDVITSKWASDDHDEFDCLFAGRMPDRSGGYAWCRAEPVPDYYFFSSIATRAAEVEIDVKASVDPTAPPSMTLDILDSTRVGDREGGAADNDGYLECRDDAVITSTGATILDFDAGRV